MNKVIINIQSLSLLIDSGSNRQHSCQLFQFHILATVVGYLLDSGKSGCLAGSPIGSLDWGGPSVWIWRLLSRWQVILLGDSPPPILSIPQSPSLLIKSLYFLVQDCCPMLITAPSGLCDITELCLVEWRLGEASVPGNSPMGVNSG